MYGNKHDSFVSAHVQQGVVPVQKGFGNFAPDKDSKRLPRNGATGQLIALEVMEDLQKASKIQIHVVQIPVFPGVVKEDMDALIEGLKKMGVQPQLILMVMEGDPMSPADETNVADVLGNGVQIAIDHEIPGVSSTSLEQWMSGQVEKTDTEFDTAVEQLSKLHARVYGEKGLENSKVESWNIEFLRPGEMMTFTKLERAWKVVQAMNKAIGGKKFFKVLVDSAHCGDSGEGIDDTCRLLEQMIDAGDVNMIHASVAKTRGHHSSDRGMRSAIITTALQKKIGLVIEEVFDNKDAGLQKLRDAGFGFGVDTGLGLSTTQILAENLEDTARRIEILLAQGVIEDPKKSEVD